LIRIKNISLYPLNTMSDPIHIYSGIFNDERGQRFLTILEGAIEHVFADVYEKTMPQQPSKFKECLSRVSSWDRSVLNEEVHKMAIYLDAQDIFKDCYVTYVKSMRSNSQKKIMINMPHFHEFLQQFWKNVSESKSMQNGRFFNGSVIDRKIICMDNARDVLYSFLTDDFVTLEDRSEVDASPKLSLDADANPYAYDLKPTNPTLSHVSISRSNASRPATIPPIYGGPNMHDNENDSIITPNDSISQVNVPAYRKREKEEREADKQDVIEESAEEVLPPSIESSQNADTPNDPPKKEPSIVSLSTISLSDSGKPLLKKSQSTREKEARGNHDDSSRRSNHDDSSRRSNHDDEDRFSHHSTHSRSSKRHEEDDRNFHRNKDDRSQYSNKPESYYSSRHDELRKKYAASQATAKNSDAESNASSSASRTNVREKAKDDDDASSVSSAASDSRTLHSRVRTDVKSTLSHISEDESD
jgi:hypothetical protein